MSNIIKTLKHEKINTMSEEEISKEIEIVKNKTREAGIRMLHKCDETEDVAEITQIMLDDQKNCTETIVENLNELDQKVKESKSLSKQFASWFSIFRSTKTTATHYVIKEEKPNNEKNHNMLFEKKEKQKYEFNSEDPAEEIAEALEKKLDKLIIYANGFNESMNKQKALLDEIEDKIGKSDCDVKNVTRIIKKY